MKVLCVAAWLRSLCLAGVGLLAVQAQAQVVTDDFTSSTNWVGLGPSEEGELQISGGRAHYIVSTPGEQNSSLLLWQSGFGSAASDWEVKVDVHMPVADGSDAFIKAGQTLSASLQVLRIGGGFGGEEGGFGLFGLTSAVTRTGSAGNAFVSSRLSLGESNDLSVAASPEEGLGADASLRIAYDASTTTLSAFFDLDGGGSAYDWSFIQSVNVVSDWGVTPEDFFFIVLSAESGTEGECGLEIPADTVYFDDFSASGLMAVPEPSTYAALAGAGALAWAGWRRRRAARA